MKWWEAELERGYVLHLARCLLELSPSPTAFPPVSIFAYRIARTGPLHTVQVASLDEGSEGEAGKIDDVGEGEGRGVKRRTLPSSTSPRTWHLNSILSYWKGFISETGVMRDVFTVLRQKRSECHDSDQT